MVNFLIIALIDTVKKRPRIFLVCFRIKTFSLEFSLTHGLMWVGLNINGFGD